jgi:hypothetical protein
MSKDTLLHVRIEGTSPQRIKQAASEMGCSVYSVTRTRNKNYTGNGYVGYGTKKIVPRKT